MIICQKLREVKKINLVYAIILLSVIVLAVYTIKYRLFDYFHINENRVTVSLSGDESMFDGVRVIWVIEREPYLVRSGNLSIYDSIEVFAKGRALRSVPDEHGPNRIFVYYNNTLIKQVTYYKFRRWHKLNFIIDLNVSSEKIVMCWKTNLPPFKVKQCSSHDLLSSTPTGASVPLVPLVKSNRPLAFW
jgi:hypothetical protein